MSFKRIAFFLLAILFVFSLSISVSGADPLPPEIEFEQEYGTLYLELNKSEHVKVWIENPLTEDDTIDLTISQAQNVLEWNEPMGTNTTCSSNSDCTIEIGAGERIDLDITFEGKIVDTSSLVFEATSRRSNLDSKKTKDVRVSMSSIGGLFTAPGISFSGLIVIASLSTLIVLFASERE